MKEATVVLGACSGSIAPKRNGKMECRAMLYGIDGTIRSQFWHSKCEIWCAWMAEETVTDRGGDAVKERLALQLCFLWGVQCDRTSWVLSQEA